MRKGCFIKSVVIVTILIAVIIYLIEHKFDDWVVKPGKKIILSEVAKNWDNEDEFIAESTEKDSLRSLMKYYLKNIKTFEEVVNLDEINFLKELGLATEDSLVTENELSKLSSLLKKE